MLTLCKRANVGSNDDFGGAGDAHGSEDGANERKPLHPRPKMLPYGKKAQPRGGAVAFVFEEVMAVGVWKTAKEVEGLGDTGLSCRVCTNLSLMWDVPTWEKPILLRQLVGDIEVYTTGTVQLECPNDSGGTTVVSLLKTCYIPDAKVNLFSLQKLRKALYVTEQEDKLGT